MLPEEYTERLEYELGVIESMGYSGYFETLAHILKEARREGIRIGPGRGSAGGSLVAYALGITDLDPVAHGLLFERFLNPQRASLPDIDVDVAEHQRPQFLELVRRFYGDEYVAVIATYGTIGAKAALKDANRVLGGAYSRGEELASQLPPAKFGRSPGLDSFTGPRESTYDLACGLEGLVRNVGQHAAGVIISPEKLADALPLQHPAGQSGWVTGFDMHEVDKLGFTKFDFLGLRNLGIIDDCLRLLPGSGISLPLLPDECSDQATYELLASGNTLGVFQLDSPGMRGLLRLLRPTRFDDISAVLALYRPGPMGANAHLEYAHRKRDSGGVWSSDWAIHPELVQALRPILEDTYGLIVFQEQVLQCLNAVCGWSYAEAALLFDAMRKKNHEKMQATKPAYESAGSEKGFSAEALQSLWETLVPFADYSFNRAHTAGYGLVAYWTAFLKANYPAEYMAALLSSVSDDPDRLHDYLRDAERMQIRLLPPDINVSNSSFTPDGKDIRYGLSAIHGVGDKAVEGLASCRPYANLSDLFERAPSGAVNGGVVSALARSGALDSLCPDREALVSATERFVKLAQDARKAYDRGQPLLVLPTYQPAQTHLDRVARQRWESETLGVSLSQTEVVLEVKGWLSEPDLIYIKKIIDGNPGSSKVVLDFGLTKYTVPATMALTDRAATALQALQTVEVSEG